MLSSRQTYCERNSDTVPSFEGQMKRTRFSRLA